MATLKEAVGVLEELAVDLVDEGQHTNREPLAENPLEVAFSVQTANFEAAEHELEARETKWLARNPECWSNFRLIVLDPWQKQTEQLRGVAAAVKRLACILPGVGQPFSG